MPPLLSLALVSLAAFSARLAITEPDAPSYKPLLIIAAYTIATGLIAAIDSRTHILCRSTGYSPRLSRIGFTLGALLLVTPFIEGFSRIWHTAYFRPLEQITIVALTNFAFFSQTISRIPRINPAGIAASFALLLASVMLGEHRAIVPIAAAYGGLAVVWMAGRHWRSMHSATSPSNNIRFPRLPVLCMMLLLATITGLSTKIAQGLPDIWGEWVPSSGGSRWANPAALLGVGDGDWVVGGPNAKSTGSIDTEYYLESSLPTLYDVLTESYGEPRTPEEIQRAIFVKPEHMPNRANNASDTGEAGRQFSMYRKGRSQYPQPDSKEAKALFYIDGPLPIHLAMTVYSQFDGINWHELDEPQEPCRAETHDTDTSWLWLTPSRISDRFGGTRRHQIRFGQLSTDRLPLPNCLQRIRLGRHGGKSLTRWAKDVLVWAHVGILRTRSCLPTGTFLETESQVIDQAKLLLSHNPFRTTEDKTPHLQVPDHLRITTETLAQQFAHHPRGWPQINALIDHLQTNYTHDPDATIPPTCPDPIHYFIHDARRGPSYQFATAATMTLRTLGYPTRVASGFYAGPDDYVVQTGHSAIHSTNAHFWIQVHTDETGWITLDPTPGYRTEWYQPTLLARFNTNAMALVKQLLDKPIISSLGILFGIGLWFKRLRLAERLLTLWCLFGPFRHPQRRLVHTLRLLDLRSRLAGNQRPASATPLAWYHQFAEPACHVFIRNLYEVLYNTEETASTINCSEMAETCRTTVRLMSSGKLRRRSVIP